jgi:hypothetical protein
MSRPGRFRIAAVSVVPRCVTSRIKPQPKANKVLCGAPWDSNPQPAEL